MTRVPAGGARPVPRDEETARLGMIVFLASWAMLFAGLFFSYGVLRLRLTAWPPPGAPQLPAGLALSSTAVLLASSLMLEHAIRRSVLAPLRRIPSRPESVVDGEQTSPPPLPRWAALRASSRRPGQLGGALGLGLLFLTVQALLWWSLLSRGLHWGDGTIASVVYGLVAFHAAHVVVGLIGLTKVWWSTRTADELSAPVLPLKLWTLYWHFVGVVWVLVLVFVFLL